MTSPQRQKALHKLRLTTPEDDEWLHWWVTTYLGVHIPNQQVCVDHDAPFTAFADAFFGRGDAFVCHGSRLFGGKTFMSAVLGLTRAILLGAEVNILGGSQEQAETMQAYMKNEHENTRGLLWEAKRAPQYLLKSMTATLIRLSNGGMMRAMAASQKSTRGKHGTDLYVDEADECEWEVFTSALGQTYEGTRGINPLTFITSTWQKPDGTMTALFDMVEEKNREGHNWRVYTWCLGESMRVLTQRGEVSIKDVTTDDQVMTRKGWRSVQHVTKMGRKKTIEVKMATGRNLRLTPDHRVATPLGSGWIEAGLLQPVQSRELSQAGPAVTPVVGRGVEIGSTIGVSLGAMSLDTPPVVAVMDSAPNRDNVAGIDTSVVPAGVMEVAPFRNLSAPQDKRSTMRKLGAKNPVNRSRDSITGCIDPLLPDPTPVVVLELDAIQDVLLSDIDYIASSVPSVPACNTHSSRLRFDPTTAFTESHVVSISEGAYEDVYDIGVEGEHEFVAEGVVVHNCYRETHEKVGGHNTQKAIDKKKAEMTQLDWDNEVELQRPEAGDLVFSQDIVDFLFEDDGFYPNRQELPDRVGKNYILIPPAEGETFYTGTDWAKRKDYTVIHTGIEVPDGPDRVAAWCMRQKEPWPMMIDAHNRRIQQYGGSNFMDGTGIGGVIQDFVTVDHEAIEFSNRKIIHEMYSSYIAAIESGEYRYPNIPYLRKKFQLLTREQVFEPGKKAHTPDPFVAGALAHKAKVEQTFQLLLGRAY